jgi:hypothetical protein
MAIGVQFRILSSLVIEPYYDVDYGRYFIHPTGQGTGIPRLPYRDKWDYEQRFGVYLGLIF